MNATFYAFREKIQNLRIENYTRMHNSFAFHSTVEVVLIRRGCVQAWIGEEEMLLMEGDVAVILSNEAHQFHSKVDPGEYTSVYIPAFLCADFIESVKSKRARYPIVRDPIAVARILSAVDVLSGEKINPIEEKGYIHVILGTALRHLSFEGDVGSRGDASLQRKLLLYINEHFKEEISVESAASALGYSAQYLSESFRACFHVGVGHYINTIRLKNAIALLRERKKSITECAMESGFGSMRTFYRVFEAEMGCTPREYLRREKIVM